MWILYAFGSALFAGLTAILAKCGIKNTDSNVATALRTIEVLIFSWVMVFIVGAQNGISSISAKVMLFLVLSGLSTGASWLCCYKTSFLLAITFLKRVDRRDGVIGLYMKSSAPRSSRRCSCFSSPNSVLARMAIQS